MYTLFSGIMLSHALVGLIGLTLFWIPVVTRKGGRQHKAVGRWFMRAMWFTGVTGFAMAMLLYVDPLATRSADFMQSVTNIDEQAASLRQSGNFFLLLSLLLLTTAQRAEVVLVAKQERMRLRSIKYLFLPVSLATVGIYLGIFGVRDDSILYKVFAGVALFTSSTYLHYIFKPQINHFDWVLEHLTGAIGSGIAAHTAFFVFGANRITGSLFAGDYRLIPWIAPAAVGGLAIVIAKRLYRKKFSVRVSPVKPKVQPGFY